jgi:hypothetical protein
MRLLVARPWGRGWDRPPGTVFRNPQGGGRLPAESRITLSPRGSPGSHPLRRRRGSDRIKRALPPLHLRAGRERIRARSTAPVLRDVAGDLQSPTPAWASPLIGLDLIDVRRSAMVDSRNRYRGSSRARHQARPSRRTRAPGPPPAGGQREESATTPPRPPGTSRHPAALAAATRTSDRSGAAGDRRAPSPSRCPRLSRGKTRRTAPPAAALRARASCRACSSPRATGTTYSQARGRSLACCTCMPSGPTSTIIRPSSDRSTSGTSGPRCTTWGAVEPARRTRREGRCPWHPARRGCRGIP